MEAWHTQMTRYDKDTKPSPSGRVPAWDPWPPSPLAPWPPGLFKVNDGLITRVLDTQ